LAGMFSFYPAKVLGCFGDGGAVVTNDEEMARKLLLLRDHGRAETGEIAMFGYNSRLDNLQAAIMDVKLKYYDQVMKRRREIASFYQEGLGNLKQVTLPPAPDADPNHFDIYQNYEIEADRRDDLKTYLQELGIGTIIQWGGRAVHQNPKLGLDHGHLKNTERMTARFLMLPMSMAVSTEDVAYVIENIRNFYRG
jgi:dTDP-4-amino-4,6-dideoxygalactose transaminase